MTQVMKSGQRRLRLAALFVGISLVHYFCTGMAMLATNAAMTRQVEENAAMTLAWKVLSFPVLTVTAPMMIQADWPLAQRFGARIPFWMLLPLMLFNSLLWSGLITFGAARWARSRARRAAGKGGGPSGGYRR